MEYSLARTLDDHFEITNVPFPHLTATPATDFVNPGLGQINSLYETFVPLRGQSLHTLEKKVEATNDEIEKNLNKQLEKDPEQTGFGETKLEPLVHQSFMNPIVTDSIIFPKSEKSNSALKRKETSNIELDTSKPKKQKSDHKFKIV